VNNTLNRATHEFIKIQRLSCPG